MKVHPSALQRFGRDPKIILARDGFRCLICHSANDLTIDHIDGNGRNSKKPNNEMSNLRTLCRSCHGRIDQKRARKWADLPEESKIKKLSNFIWFRRKKGDEKYMKKSKGLTKNQKLKKLKTSKLKKTVKSKKK